MFIVLSHSPFPSLSFLSLSSLHTIPLSLCVINPPSCCSLLFRLWLSGGGGYFWLRHCRWRSHSDCCPESAGWKVWCGHQLGRRVASRQEVIRHNRPCAHPLVFHVHINHWDASGIFNISTKKFCMLCSLNQVQILMLEFDCGSLLYKLVYCRWMLMYVSDVVQWVTGAAD